MGAPCRLDRSPGLDVGPSGWAHERVHPAGTATTGCCCLGKTRQDVPRARGIAGRGLGRTQVGRFHSLDSVKDGLRAQLPILSRGAHRHTRHPPSLAVVDPPAKVGQSVPRSSCPALRREISGSTALLDFPRPGQPTKCRGVRPGIPTVPNNGLRQARAELDPADVALPPHLKR